MTAYRLTHAQLERIVASLRGLRITQIDYALLTGGPDGNDILEWDYGAFHEPTMGLQLTSDIGAAFTVTWGSSFGYYSMETHDRTITDLLARIGEPGGPTILAVGHHPRWRHLLGREITNTEAAWIDWVSGDPTICWIRLEFAPADESEHEPESIWIVSGRWNQDRFHLGSDDVTVIFDRAEAARAKVTAQTASG